MDTIDRSDSNLPARFSLNPLPLQTPLVSQDLAIASAPQITPQIILRGLIRNWWQILLLWLVVSAPLIYVIFQFIQPTFEAFSLLRVEPSAPILFAQSNTHENSGTALAYLQTQVQLIKSDQVLSVAVANALISNLPTIKESDDPKTDLRKKLLVEIVQDAYLIRVALESTSPKEAAAIVNAVVEAYRAHTEQYAQSANKRLRESLDREDQLLRKQIKSVETLLSDMVQNGRVGVPPTKDILNNKKKSDDDDGNQPTFKNLGEEEYQRSIAEMMTTDSELLDAESKLAVLEQAAKKNVSGEQGPSGEDLEAQIAAAFKKDPEVAGLMAEIREALEQLEHAKEMARQPHDAAALAAHKHHGKLMARYKDLWEIRHDEILQDLQGANSSSALASTINDLTLKVAALKDKKERQIKNFEKVEFKNRAANTESFQSTMLNHTLISLQNKQDNVSNHLSQLAFESNQESFRIVLVDPAAIPITPSNNKRLKLMAAAPVGVLFMILGLFMLLEVKAERVADPDALSTRVQSKVYALPPLPTARSLRKMSMPDADDQIEQFIQRLDHLRFALCGTSVELGKGRCVLITSATGGEGKTTLAAQLAARCGNAGMSTILIDADLRRAALCLLLDVPEGPGLSDVLKDEATLEDVVIPVQGGTFVLLPAGTAVQDTSRILQSRKVGELIAQLRQVYDLIIIDSPPVLPVPDGLILGRWADGAVLAARYDISRFPQVERARRQLDSAGVPVLGTVINGMRSSDSYSGSYAYNRRRSSTPESSDAV
jgi:polysaccharide biosynthesis transport protein